ncbi:hypothetical protein [Rhizobium sp. CF142]|uniref:hypothetical protein n=1 Tax=Rhizobium sp. CF142 TaxID=1144314 RepID=UPI00055E8ED2|nr:hypothetical protein [Rhizobium sp. CF142]
MKQWAGAVKRDVIGTPKLPRSLCKCNPKVTICALGAFFMKYIATSVSVVSAFLFAYDWFNINIKYLVYMLVLIVASIFGALVAHAWREDE